MGKRSDFKRVERDMYPTPLEAVIPLVPHLLYSNWKFWEPCAGNGALADHLDRLNVPRFNSLKFIKCSPSLMSDIEPQRHDIKRQDAMTALCPPNTDFIITNPPWNRKILHPMIERFSAMRPTWLLFDADWAHTKQSSQYMKCCHKIVSVGRVKWFPDSKMTGKDNVSWYLFDQKIKASHTAFYGR